MLRKLRRGAQGSPPSTLREDHTDTQVRAAGVPHAFAVGKNTITPEETFYHYDASRSSSKKCRSTTSHTVYDVGRIYLHQHNSSGRAARARARERQSAEPEGQAPASPAARGGAALAR